MGDMDGGGNSLSQTAYRFRNDDGTEVAWIGGVGSGASYMAAINTAIDVVVGSSEKIRCRICCESSGETTQFRMERRLNSGSWISITMQDTAIRIGVTQLYGGNSTTDLTGTVEDLSDANWADVTNGCMLDDTVATTGEVTFSSGQDKRIEIEMSVDIYWARPIRSGDTLEIRATANGQTFYGDYYEIPMINIIDDPDAAEPHPVHSIANRNRVYGGFLGR